MTLRKIPSRPFDPPTLAKKGRSEIVPELREAVWSRSGGLCECCGGQLERGRWECHHRKLRSRGGQDSVTNLVALHPMCHRRAHGHVAWAEEVGLIVSAFADPLAVPLALHGESWVQLTTAGTYRPVRPSEES